MVTDEKGEGLNTMIKSLTASRILEFARENNWDKVSKTTGLISPDGLFYPCAVEGHTALAEEICQTTLSPSEMEQLENKSRHIWGDQYIECLYKRGWFGVSNIILVGEYDDHSLTPEQIEVVKMLIEYVEGLQLEEDAIAYQQNWLRSIKSDITVVDTSAPIIAPSFRVGR